MLYLLFHKFKKFYVYQILPLSNLSKIYFERNRINFNVKTEIEFCLENIQFSRYCLKSKLRCLLPFEFS